MPPWSLLTTANWVRFKMVTEFSQIEIWSEKTSPWSQDSGSNHLVFSTKGDNLGRTMCASSRKLKINRSWNSNKLATKREHIFLNVAHFKVHNVKGYFGWILEKRKVLSVIDNYWFSCQPPTHKSRWRHFCTFSQRPVIRPAHASAVIACFAF